MALSVCSHLFRLICIHCHLLIPNRHHRWAWFIATISATSTSAGFHMLPLISIPGLLPRYQSTWHATVYMHIIHVLDTHITFHTLQLAPVKFHMLAPACMHISELISICQQYYTLRFTLIYFYHFHLLLSCICSWSHVLLLTAIKFRYVPFSSMYNIFLPRTTSDGI